MKDFDSLPRHRDGPTATLADPNTITAFVKILSDCRPFSGMLVLAQNII
jgi:hypothetical protein